MAAARRITINTHVLPQKYATKTIPAKSSSSRSIAAIEGTLEHVDHDKAAYTNSTSSVGQSTYNKYIIDSAVGKSLGGKSSSYVATNTSQSWNGWTSMEHPKMYWEAHDGNDTDDDGIWERTSGGRGIWWGGVALATSTPTTFSPISHNMAYGYIKNVGSTAIYISLNSATKFQIKISPGAAFSYRSHGTNVVFAVRYKTLSGTSYAEYVLARD